MDRNVDRHGPGFEDLQTSPFPDLPNPGLLDWSIARARKREDESDAGRQN